MGQLYQLIQDVDRLIKASGREYFSTKGRIGMEAGFMLALHGPSAPDDPEKIKRLREAVLKILGKQL